MLKPIHDMTIHVGGANAGIRLSRSTTRKTIASVAKTHLRVDSSTLWRVWLIGDKRR